MFNSFGGCVSYVPGSRSANQILGIGQMICLGFVSTTFSSAYTNFHYFLVKFGFRDRDMTCWT